MVNEGNYNDFEERLLESHVRRQNQVCSTGT